MSIARKMATVALFSIVALAIGTASTSAITVTNEDEDPTQGIACGAVPVNGHSVTQNGEDCVLHVIQREPIDFEVFGATVSTCNNEFSAMIGSNGLGAIIRQTLSNATPGSCTATPCSESGSNDPWPITQQTEGLPDNWTMRVTFCLNLPVGGTANCTFDIPYVVGGHSVVIFGTTGLEYDCSGMATRQLHGSWVTEDIDDPDIEIRH